MISSVLFRRIILSVGLISATTQIFSQTYSSQSQLTRRLKALETANGSLVKLQSLATTIGGKNLWVLEIGSGDRANHPAVAVVGGVDGTSLISQELAIGFAEKLLAGAQKKDSIKNLLSTTTFYVFPSVSPDAADQYFAALKYERTANASPTDDDRDGRLNEDPFEDLNSDGMISWIRVEDPTGKWKTHPADERVMVAANAENGEQGKYIVLTEGIDNDKDKKFNEDPEGGVAFNKNMTFDPPYFTAGAGEHPVSEIEDRALLDYLFDRFNIFSVVSFGPANNLSDPWKFDKSKTSARIITGILENDAKVNKMASDLYKKSITTKDAPTAAPTKGDFSQWTYFHYGRVSFSTPGWFVPKFELPKDSTAAKKFKKNEDKNTDVDFLRWAEKEGQDVFIPWKKIEHPDFPGKNVEVGGLKPFVKTNPPFKLVNKLIEDHTKFILALAAGKPEVDIINQKTETLDNGVARITITVKNKGLFPTVAEIATNNYWIKLVKVSVSVSTGQTIISGNKVTLLPTLQPGESKEMTWLIQGKGKLALEAGAPQTGIKKLDVTL